MICDTSVCDSAWVFINCSGGNGIGSISENQINIYPNPASGIVNITGVENGNYSVVDINGRLIHSGSLNNSKSINLEDEPAGVYFIKITNALKSSTVKVIKL